MRKKKQIQNELKSCGDLSLDIQRSDTESGDDPLSERIKEKAYDVNREHPTPEQMLMREAVKYLTFKQKRVWEMYNFDKLTQDQIAKKLNVTQQTIQESIKAIEKRIAKWVKNNLEAYNLLKSNSEEKQ